MKSKRFHLICDLANCNNKIDNKEEIESFLKSLVSEISMNILDGPHIKEGIPQNPGLSGVVIIDFSSITIHTFTDTNESLIDIFSCKPFDKDKAADFCVDFFKADKENSRIKEVCWG